MINVTFNPDRADARPEMTLEEFNATIAADLRECDQAPSAVALARERAEQAERAARICKAALDRLDELTDGLDSDQYRDVLDELAGHIEARLEAQDEADQSDSREPEDKEQ